MELQLHYGIPDFGNESIYAKRTLQPIYIVRSILQLKACLDVLFML